MRHFGRLRQERVQFRYSFENMSICHEVPAEHAALFEGPLTMQLVRGPKILLEAVDESPVVRRGGGGGGERAVVMARWPHFESTIDATLFRKRARSRTRSRPRPKSRAAALAASTTGTPGSTGAPGLLPPSLPGMDALDDEPSMDDMGEDEEE